MKHVDPSVRVWSIYLPCRNCYRPLPPKFCKLQHCACGCRACTTEVLTRLLLQFHFFRYDQSLVCDATISVSVLRSSSLSSFSSCVLTINIFYLSSYLLSLSYNFCYNLVVWIESAGYLKNKFVTSAHHVRINNTKITSVLILKLGY